MTSSQAFGILVCSSVIFGGVCATEIDSSSDPRRIVDAFVLSYGSYLTWPLSDWAHRPFCETDCRIGNIGLYKMKSKHVERFWLSRHLTAQILR